MIQLRLVDRFKFLIERQLSHGPFNQLIIVAGAIALVSIVGGAMLFAAGTEQESFREAMWWAFLRLTDPGYLGDDEGNWRRLLSTLLTVAGYVLFMGTLVAIMTQWLLRKMRMLEQGLTPVTFRGHIVVLGWSSRTSPLVKEVFSHLVQRGLRHKLKNKPVAVLADDITEGPLEEVQGDVELRSRNRKLVLRSGSVLNPEHLARVNVREADTIIIPSSGHVSSLLSADAEIIKVLASLPRNRLGSERDSQAALNQWPTVIAELQDSRKISIARRAYPGELHIVASDSAVSRALARSLIVSGMSEVLTNLLIDPTGAQLYLLPAGALKGKRWGTAKHYVAGGISCGLIGSASGLRLNPGKDTLVDETDNVVVIARRAPELMNKPVAGAVQNLGSNDSGVIELARNSGKRKRVLMLGWNRRVPALLDELAGYGDVGFDLTSVSSSPIDERRQDFEERMADRALVSRPDIEFHQADYTFEHTLRQYEPSEFDVVMMFSSDRLLSGEEADARTIVGYLVLEQLLQKEKVKPRIILELSDASNEAFVSDQRNEVLISSLMVSHVMAQIAMYPALRFVYDELLAASGADIVIQPMPDSWQGEARFSDLQRRLSASGVTLIGIQSESETLLSPEWNHVVTCNETTQLVILV